MPSLHRARLLLALLAFFTIVYAPKAFSSTLYVTPSGNDSNAGTSWALAKLHVGATITAANAGDQIWVEQGTYAENITLKPTVKLYGGFLGAEILLAQRDFVNNITVIYGTSGTQGGPEMAAVTISSTCGLTTVVDGFSMKNNSGNGIDCLGSPIINNCNITGVLYGIQNSGTPTLDNCSFNKNVHGISTSSPLSISNCSSNNNTSEGIISTSSLTLTNCVFDGNGYNVLCDGAVTMTSCTITNGFAHGVQSGQITITNCTINNNGFGVYASGTSNITSCTITGNGCGIISQGSGMLTVTNCNIGGSKSLGGIYITGGSAKISDCTIQNNTVNNTNTSPAGGGVGFEETGGTGSLSLVRCKLTGNSTPYNGGGVDCNGGSVGNPCIIKDNVIALNSTSKDGGGISCSGYATIANNTISDNGAGSSAYGGGIALYNTTASTAQIANNIVSFNSSGISNPGGFVQTLSHNDVYGNTYYQYSAIAAGAGDIAANPVFANRNTYDYHLTGTSFCINAGNNAYVVTGDVDLDSNPRISGTQVDMGAYEYQLTPPNANAQSVTTNQNTAVGVTLTGSDPNSLPLTYSVTTAPAHGTLTGTAPTLNYTPNGGYSGADSFQFEVNNGQANSHPTTVSITVTQNSDNTTHVLWTHNDGTASIWNYSTADGSFSFHNYGPYSGWTAKAIADGGTDGKLRVLWVNTSGKASLWSLDNTTGSFVSHDFGPYNGWYASALSVGADNTTHVLWNNYNGTASLWNYDAIGGNYTYKNYGPYSHWAATAVADGKTGNTRLLWANVDGQASVWSLDNTTGSFVSHNFGPYNGWYVSALSVGADNTTHVLWNNYNGTASLWNYDAIGGNYTYKNYGPYSGWTPKTIADGADGKTHILWDNTDGTLSLWNLDNGTGSYDYYNFGPYNGWTAVGLSAGQ